MASSQVSLNLLKSSPLRWTFQRAWLSTTSSKGELYKSVPEQPVPIEGQVKGSLPIWLNGRLIRNGPGLFEIGDTKLNHFFDGMALLHSFTIQAGKVTYTSKFLRSDAYTKNMAANRLVVSEFGTYALPDPCQTLFQKVKSYFSSLTDPSHGMTDNCLVNVFPVGDKFAAATESDFIHVFSSDTLDTEQKVQLSKHVAVNMATAHPHIDTDGTVYNLGSSQGGYTIIKIPPVGQDTHVMDRASVLCTVPPKNKLKPSYNHSFGATENHFVFLEQSIRVNVPRVLSNKLLNKPVLAEDVLVGDDTEMVRFFVVEKSSGKVLPGKFLAPPTVVFHHINAFEDNGHIVLDACASYGAMAYFDLDLNAMNANPEMNMEQSELRRYVLPIDPSLQNPTKENLVTLDYSKATAKLQEDGSIICHHEVIAEKKFDLPRINYEKNNGKPYQFVYGTITPFIELVKADVRTKKCLTWREDGCSVSEPVFVGNPAGSREDDGVILSAVLRVDESQPPFLLVLDAMTMSEVGRVEFPGIQWHKDFHGIFVPSTI